MTTYQDRLRTLFVVDMIFSHDLSDSFTIAAAGHLHDFHVFAYSRGKGSGEFQMSIWSFHAPSTCFVQR